VAVVADVGRRYVDAVADMDAVTVAAVVSVVHEDGGMLNANVSEDRGRRDTVATVVAVADEDGGSSRWT